MDAFMETVDVAGYQFHYTLSGQLDGVKPAILFLHGFMGDCHTFDRIIPWLKDDFSCLSVDLPGHGQTKTPILDRSDTLQKVASALIDLLTCLGLARCALVGYSMGGRLALYLTLHFPERFVKTILESASPGLKTQVEREERIERDFKLARDLETGSFSAFLWRWYDNPLFASLRQHPEFPKIMKMRLSNDPIALAKTLRNLSTGRQPSLWEMLVDNQIPLFLLSGEFDTKFIAINTEMKQHCQTAKLKIVPGCGHNIHFEDPPTFARLLREFLEVG